METTVVFRNQMQDAFLSLTEKLMPKPVRSREKHLEPFFALL